MRKQISSLSSQNFIFEGKISSNRDIVQTRVHETDFLENREKYINSDTHDLNNDLTLECEYHKYRLNMKKIPASIMGIPLLEELYLKNLIYPEMKNVNLMRYLTHESVLFRGFLNKRMRYNRLKRFVKSGRIDIDFAKRAWIHDLGNCLKHNDFEFKNDEVT